MRRMSRRRRRKGFNVGGVRSLSPPALRKASGMATAGPMPITSGSTPTAANDTNRPII